LAGMATTGRGAGGGASWRPQAETANAKANAAGSARRRVQPGLEGEQVTKHLAARKGQWKEEPTQVRLNTAWILMRICIRIQPCI